jgi:hypothetical protein
MQPLFSYAAELKWLGASYDDLAAFGLGGIDLAPADAVALGGSAGSLEETYAGDAAARRSIPYGELVSGLPVASGVRLEFWHSLPELWSMTRQYRALKAHPAVLQLRFEDLKDAFNATALSAIKHLALGRRAKSDAVLAAMVANGCDPGQWTAERRKRSTHITSDRETEKEQVEKALLGHPLAKAELCEMAATLDYNDERCR